MGEFFRRIHYLLNRRRLDAELQNEMEFHREMAARAGRANFGNTLRMRERAFEAWGWAWLEHVIQDVRYGARILLRSPGFTVLAILVLAIGIGVNVSAFSLFNMAALKPLPVPDAERIVRLERRSPSAYTSEMAYPSFVYYSQHARTLSASVAVLGIPPMQIDDQLQPASASFVTPNYFTELGATAVLGRLLDPALDADPSAPPVVVISYGLWHSRFANDPGVLGRVVHLNNKPATVVGVTPAAFASLGGQHPDLWMPIAQQPYFVSQSTVLRDWSTSSVRMWGKLAPGVAAKGAEQELRSLTDTLRKQHPEAVWDAEFIQSSPGGHLQVMQPDMYQAAAMVGVLALLILVVSCANLGGLMLARAVSRQSEIQMRLAVGASRGRIVCQLCTESLLLSALGTFTGLALAYVVLRIALLQFDAPGWLSPMPDWRVLLFSIGLMLLATLSFGLMPALQVARQRQHKTIARQILVAVQIAASCALLIVAALLVRATQHALFTDPGFGYEQLVSIDAQLGRHAYNPAAARAYLDQMRNRLRTVPGVSAVSLVKIPPLGHVVDKEGAEINGRKFTIYPNWITPDYFQTMGIQLRLGRTFYTGEQHAVIVSSAFAREAWPGQNPLGQQVGDGAVKDTVVGVVADAHANALSDDDATEQYWPAQQSDMPDMVVMLRASGEPGSLTPSIKAISESLDPATLPEVRQLKSLYRDNVSQIETAAGIVSLIGLVAVALAAVGIIGLVAFVVTQRTREIAIRMALGASPVEVLSAVLRQFRWPLIAGLIAGTAFAAAGSRLLRVALYGLDNLDIPSYAGAVAVLAAMAAASMLVPAARTLRLNIAAILHHE